ncbi:hypothetical protein GMO_19680 [Gluconobacter morbifer G707]|uniref:Uncharacterized protein n=1 Tax=Gluconobacter morbifer G707 TaxID=1088869 RepID=G6XKF2_9PROT|nr:hypothetical protein GMO_19680 [Gluconobacter morbifer G707]
MIALNIASHNSQGDIPAIFNVTDLLQTGEGLRQKWVL